MGRKKLCNHLELGYMTEKLMKLGIDLSPTSENENLRHQFLELLGSRKCPKCDLWNTEWYLRGWTLNREKIFKEFGEVCCFRFLEKLFYDHKGNIEKVRGYLNGKNDLAQRHLSARK